MFRTGRAISASVDAGGVERSRFLAPAERPRIIAGEASALDSGRERLGRLSRVFDRPSLQRLDRARRVEVQDGIELHRQRRVEVVAHALRLRRIDDADRALETFASQRVDGTAATAQRQPEAFETCVMEQLLVTVIECRPNLLALCGTVPVGGGGYGSGVRRKPDEAHIVGMTLAHQLSNVDLTFAIDLGGARVAKMRVVRPDHD